MVLTAMLRSCTGSQHPADKAVIHLADEARTCCEYRSYRDSRI